MIDSHTFSLSPQMADKEIDKIAEILSSNEKSKRREFQTFFNRRVSCDDKDRKQRVSTAASRNIHFSTKLWIPSFYKAKRISITREKRDSWGLEINPRKGKNWSLKLSSKQSFIKDDNSPKESEYSTKSTFNKDQSSELDQKRFRNSDKQWILKLHLNKWSPEMDVKWRIS